MAGKIIADTIEASGSQISLNVGNVTVLTASSAGITSTITTANITTANITGNVLIGGASAQTGAKLSVTGSIQGTIKSGAAVSANGTSVDFTSLPSWIKRITVIFSSVTTSSTSLPLIQLGTSGGVITSGYSSASTNLQNGSTVSTTSTGSGFQIFKNVGAQTIIGAFRISNIDGNAWVCDGSWCSTSNAVVLGTTNGNINLASALTSVRVTMTNGTDTFSAGSLNIFYEG